LEAESLGLPLRSVVIPLGLEPPERGNRDAFCNLYPQLREKLIVLFLSRLDPKKNIESLLRAIAALRTEVPDFVLVIGGDGEADYVKHIKHLSDELRLSEYVYWLGRVVGDLKIDLLAASHLFVLPSFSENFGIAVLEAMFARLPCVVTPGVALSGQLSAAGAGSIVSPDPSSIAAGLRRFLYDRQAMHKAGENALRLAQERFSSATMASKILDLYRNILADFKK
jgi:glycosyltransferase involved in cell wall biosynthesis